ncbi:MAG TPA: hypothetical protein VGG46_03880 [Terriglobales bacterium]|jgi:hypothetical protein
MTGHDGSNAVFLIAQNDDPELLEWLSAASQRGGGFVQSLANAALRADEENYLLIRPLVMFMRAKYTEYEPSDRVKEEIREREKNKA